MKDRQTKQRCEKIALDDTINILASSIQIARRIDDNITKLEDRWQSYKITEGNTT